MTQYFRVTVYHEAEDISAVIDSNGMYGRLWEFGSKLIAKGFEILEISDGEQFLDGNISREKPDAAHIFLRAHCKGKPRTLPCKLDGVAYQAVALGGKGYVPDKSKAGGAV
jgi:hypothetical protein